MSGMVSLNTSLNQVIWPPSHHRTGRPEDNSKVRIVLHNQVIGVTPTIEPVGPKETPKKRISSSGLALHCLQTDAMPKAVLNAKTNVHSIARVVSY